MAKEDRSWLCPSGGGLAALSFFLPWVSCGGQSLSGARAGGILWLVFLAALGVLGCYFHFRSRGAVHQAKLPVTVCSASGLAIAVLWFLAVMNSEYSELMSIEVGWVLSLLGFGAALYGARELRLPSERPPP